MPSSCASSSFSFNSSRLSSIFAKVSFGISLGGSVPTPTDTKRGFCGDRPWLKRSRGLEVCVCFCVAAFSRVTWTSSTRRDRSDSKSQL